MGRGEYAEKSVMLSHLPRRQPAVPMADDAAKKALGVDSPSAIDNYLS